MEHRQRAREIVTKVTQADRLGGCFLAYHDHVIDELTKVFEENAKMKVRCDALDAAQALTVAT